MTFYNKIVLPQLVLLSSRSCTLIYLAIAEDETSRFPHAPRSLQTNVWAADIPVQSHHRDVIDRAATPDLPVLGVLSDLRNPRRVTKLLPVLKILQANPHIYPIVPEPSETQELEDENQTCVQTRSGNGPQ